MHQKFTLIEIEKSDSGLSGMKLQGVYPQKYTLAFIKQFAHAYHSERKLSLPVNAMILN